MVPIVDPGTLDGGDVVVAGERCSSGPVDRSNPEGMRQLEAIAALRVSRRPGADPGCLHLKSAATLVSDACLLVNPDWVDPAVFRPLTFLSIRMSRLPRTPSGSAATSFMGRRTPEHGPGSNRWGSPWCPWT